MRLAIFGQKMFGVATLGLCLDLGHDVLSVCAPPGDRLRRAADVAGVGIVEASAMPAVDLIIAAHSHDFIGRRTRARARLGAIGYHPSLLPLHRGRDAVRWAIRQRDRVTGGSVYWMNDSVDGGDIAAQEHVFIRPEDTAEELWRRELFPLGLRLLARVLGDLAAGVMVRVPQSNDLATWEPALDRVPLFRSELPQLGTIEGFEVVRSASALA